ncbi:hypothetical protein F1C58_01745 [Glaciihabitans sp. INWT7]|nr:hypothetical protein F1C58_01745 [Glaciihabitans sp. INWT7]
MTGPTARSIHDGEEDTMTTPDESSDQTTGPEPTEVLNPVPPAPASTGPSSAGPAAPVVATPARGSVLRWLTPTLAFLAVAVIFLFGGILIGQHTGAGQAAGFNRPGGQLQNGQGPQNGPRGGGQNGGQNGGKGGPPGGPGQQGNATRPGGFGGITAGTIQSVDGDTVTVKLRDGSTVTVKTTDTTTVTKSATSTVADLKAGETITVRGARDGSGSVSATSISEGANPLFAPRPGANG